MLGSAVAFAVYQLMAKRYIGRMGSTLFTSVALSAAAVTTLAHVFIVRGGLDTSMSTNYFMLAAATGLLATVVPSFFVNAGMGADRCGLDRDDLQRVAAADDLFRGDDPGRGVHPRLTRFGTALVVGGVGYHTWSEFKKRAPEEV